MRKIAESTVRRLSLYLRFLEKFEQEGIATVSSQALAERGGTTSAQVRKDLSLFGSFGTRGLVYPVRELHGQVASILGLDREWRVALIGVGNIGSALVSYKEFQRQGFKNVSIFDNDQRKIGSNHKGIVVLDTKHLQSELRAAKIQVVILAVPASVVQYIVDEVVKAGIKAILNFAPVNLRVPPDVYLRNENMAMELEYLSFALVKARMQLENSIRPD